MGTEVKVSDPVVSYRETVTMKSPTTLLSKSPNKHNRLFVEAEPLSTEVTIAIDNGEISPQGDQKVQGRMMADEYVRRPHAMKRASHEASATAT
jgi:elongation factor 2